MEHVTPGTDTLKDTGSHHGANHQPVHPHLFLVLECDRPTAGGARHSLLDVDRVVIGRGAERCHRRHRTDEAYLLELRVPGRYMSETQATIERIGHDWVLDDACSTNGSFVNGVRVTRRTLRDRDLIELGRVIFLFRSSVPTPRGAPLDLDTLRRDHGTTSSATLVPSLAENFGRLEELARSMVPITLVGPTGTGKEIAAQTVHRLSARQGALVAVNCGALAGTLLESQLFGHVRGAFSGAIRDEIGFLQAADRGTLFLDEIGALPPAAQVALLRALQEGEVTPVGRSHPIHVDLRVIAASQEPLQNLVDRGEFREDLLGRIEGFRLDLPPLSQRIEDLGILLGALLEKRDVDRFRLSSRAARLLCSYHWPRNIRELAHVIQLVLATRTDGAIGAEHLPERLLEKSRSDPSSRSELALPHAPATIAHTSHDELRRELIAHMERSRGNVSEVARTMNRSRIQIHRWLKRFGLEPPAFRNPPPSPDDA